MPRHIKQIFILILLILILIFPYFVFGQDAPPNAPKPPDMKGGLINLGKSSGYETSNINEFSVARIIGQVVKIFLSFLGIIFIILMIYGGFLWMTARGSEEQVTKAKDLIQAAIIGLIIVVAAYAISYFIFGHVARTTLTPVL